MTQWTLTRFVLVSSWSLSGAGCAAAKAISPDDGASPPVCPVLSGFSAVGTVWDYALDSPVFTGWERSQLVSLDAATGEVEIDTSGWRDGGAFTNTFERSDVYLCSDDGVRLMRWTSTVTLGTGVGEVSGTVEGAWESGIRILESDEEMGRLPPSWWAESIGEWFDISGETHELDERVKFLVGDPETLTLLGTTVESIPISVDDVPWIWVAPDIGIVKRGGLTLDSYSLGSGVLME